MQKKIISLNGQLSYLPHRRRLSLDDENIELYVSIDGNVETSKDVRKEEKKIKKPGLLNWLKLRVSLLCSRHCVLDFFFQVYSGVTFLTHLLINGPVWSQLVNFIELAKGNMLNWWNGTNRKFIFNPNILVPRFIQELDY